MRSHPLPIPQKREKFDFSKFKSISPRLIALLKPEVKILSFGLLALLGGSLLNLVFPYLIREFLNKSSFTGLAPYLGKLTFLLIILFLLQGVFFFFRHYYLQLVGLHIVTRLKSQLMNAFLIQEISFFDSARAGDLLSRLGADTEVVQRGLSINVSVVIRYSIQVLGGLLLMMFLSIKLSLILLLLIPLLVILSLFWSKKLRTLSKKVQDALGDSTTCAEEALSGIRVVKIFASEEKESERFSKSIDHVLGIAKERTRIAAMFSSSMITILHISIAVVFWFGISAVLKEDLSSGDLTAFLLYCTIVAVSFGFLTNAWAEFVQSIGAAERIYEILDRTPLITSPSNPQTISRDNGFHISLRNVRFYYPTRPEHPALDSISFDIEAGKTIALVGPSGSGKSTIAALLPRLYDPTEGEITLNGTPLKNLSLKELRSHISFVPQQTHLFSSSLRYNLTYGSEHCTDEEIKKALEQASLEDLLERLPQGLETPLGDKGIQLSGGERQRISIARALLQNPDILILDEATSSLDSENERIIQNALQTLLVNRTTLIIAHRLSTIQHADTVLVLKNGAIIQKGNHATLMKEKGLYQSMVEFQLLG